MSRFNRRVFLGRTVAGGFAARAIAGGRLSGGVLGANDDVRLAVVGLGSKIKNGDAARPTSASIAISPVFASSPFATWIAVSSAREMDDFGRRNEKVEAYSDVRKLLENKDIDAISITTPNHWHALLTIWACQAGKDVYVQKPASHNISEGRRMVEAADKYHRIVMCPNGSREPHGFIEALDYVRQGNLGKVRTIRGLKLPIAHEHRQSGQSPPCPFRDRLRSLVRPGPDRAGDAAQFSITTGIGCGSTATATLAIWAFTTSMAAAWPLAARCLATSSASADDSATMTTAKRPILRSSTMTTSPLRFFWRFVACRKTSRCRGTPMPPRTPGAAAQWTLTKASPSEKSFSAKTGMWSTARRSTTTAGRSRSSRRPRPN